MCKNVSSESRYSVLARAIAGTASNNFVITKPVALWGGLGAVIGSMILHSRREYPRVSLLPVVAGREEEGTAKVENPPCVSRDSLFARGNTRVFRPVCHCAFAFLSRICCSLCLPESSKVHFHVSIILLFLCSFHVFSDWHLISLMENYNIIEGYFWHNYKAVISIIFLMVIW